MKGKTTGIRRLWLDFLLFELLGAGLGMIISVFISTQAQTINGLTDPTAYQNFGLSTGAVTGIGIALLAMLCYLAAARLTHQRELFHFRLYIWVAGIAGAITTITTYCLVTGSAERYGIVERTGTVAVVDGVISTLLGGSTGAVVSALLSAIRGYND